MKQQHKPKERSKKGVSAYVVIFMLVILMASMIYATSLASSIVKKRSAGPFEIRFIPYDFQVSNYAGFVVDTDALHFGTASPGAMLSRTLNLTSSEDVFVEILWQGDGNLSVDTNDFVLNQGETQTVRFYVSIPQNMSYGNYSGLVYVHFYKQD